MGLGLKPGTQTAWSQSWALHSPPNIAYGANNQDVTSANPTIAALYFLGLFRLPPHISSQYSGHQAHIVDVTTYWALPPSLRNVQTPSQAIAYSEWSCLCQSDSKLDRRLWKEVERKNATASPDPLQRDRAWDPFLFLYTPFSSL